MLDASVEWSKSCSALTRGDRSGQGICSPGFVGPCLTVLSADTRSTLDLPGRQWQFTNTWHRCKTHTLHLSAGLQDCFEFHHPNSDGASNDRSADLEFEIEVACQSIQSALTMIVLVPGTSKQGPSKMLICRIPHSSWKSFSQSKHASGKSWGKWYHPHWSRGRFSCAWLRRLLWLCPKP